MKLQKHCKFLFTGDSVTDCGRTRPVGETGWLGTGYPALIDAFLSSSYPDYGIRVVNTGISGNTSLDLLNRWKEDVLDLNPDWVSVLIGINDIWRRLDNPTMPERAVLLPQYKENLEAMLKQAADCRIQMVLISPFFMEGSRDDLMRKLAEEYSQVGRKLAEKYGAVFVDAQSAFDEYLKHNYSAALSWDRVHPNLTGHMIVARAVLKALDFEQ